jgi:hypothetical protein
MAKFSFVHPFVYIISYSSRYNWLCTLQLAIATGYKTPNCLLLVSCLFYKRNKVVILSFGSSQGSAFYSNWISDIQLVFHQSDIRRWQPPTSKSPSFVVCYSLSGLRLDFLIKWCIQFIDVIFPVSSFNHDLSCNNLCS